MQLGGTSFFPAGAAVLLVATLVGNLLGSGIDWFSLHQAALGSYVAAGLFAARVRGLATYRTTPKAAADTSTATPS